jgi:hypothetical protein
MEMFVGIWTGEIGFAELTEIVDICDVELLPAIYRLSAKSFESQVGTYSQFTLDPSRSR